VLGILTVQSSITEEYPLLRLLRLVTAQGFCFVVAAQGFSQHQALIGEALVLSVALLSVCVIMFLQNKINN
jgi:hypothetical protein